MEERPLVRREAANILNSSRGQPTSGGPPAWGLGEALTAPYIKNLSCYGMLTQKASELG
jgi:hypothetical protein